MDVARIEVRLPGVLLNRKPNDIRAAVSLEVMGYTDSVPIFTTSVSACFFAQFQIQKKAKRVFWYSILHTYEPHRAPFRYLWIMTEMVNQPIQLRCHHYLTFL
jgi:hypothetical protein